MNNMKKDLNKKQKNILIGALLAIVLVMAVGYAAFQTSLNITNTAQIDSKWDIHFDTTKTSGQGVIDTTTGLQGAQAPTGTIEYSNGQNATVSAELNQPGDSVQFTLTIVNDGTIDATTNGVTVAGATPTGQQSVTTLVPASGTTSGQAGTYTTENGNIRFVITDPEDPLYKKGSTGDKRTMTVTATFIDTVTGTASNTTNDTIYPTFLDTTGSTGNLTTHETAAITIGLNYTQYVAPQPAFTGTIYRNNSNILYLNEPMIKNETIYYPSDYESAQAAYESEYEEYFSDEADCLAYVDGYDLECSFGTITIGPGDYVTSNPSQSLGDVYLKHTITNNIVTASYVCFTYTGNEVCLQGGVDECSYDGIECTAVSKPVYTLNESVLKGGVTEWFMQQNGHDEYTCQDDEDYLSRFNCSISTFNAVATNDGRINVESASSEPCTINEYGASACGMGVLDR